jgi:hypothetical protein
MYIVLHPAGAQLSTANDSGYIEVGVYDASQFAGALSAADAGARGAGMMNVRAALEEAGAKLSIESMIVRDADGTVHHGALPLEDRPFELDVTLRLDGPEGTGLPVTKVNMYVDGLPAGSKHIPYLPSGHSRTIRMYYDPSGHVEATPMKSLGVRVFSEATGFSRDGEDPLSHALERELIGKVDDIDDKDDVDDDVNGKSSGGGCDAGLGASLFLILLAAVAWSGLRKQK